MSLENYLQKLEDFEIAFLIRYRANSFLPHSKKQIQTEISNRNLTEEKINTLIHEKTSEIFNKKNINKQCPFCKSYNIFTFTKEEANNSYSNAIDGFIGQGKNITTKEQTCNICGTNLHSKKNNIWNSLSKLFFN